MGDGARGGACDRFITEFGSEIEKAQGETDGSYVGVNDALQVVFCLDTKTRSYCSNTIIFEPDSDDESNLNSLMDALRIEDGSSGCEEKRKAIIERMKKVDIMSQDYTE